MVDIMATAKGFLPNISMAQMGQWAYWGALFLGFLIIIGGLTVWWVYSYIQKKKFNKKIILWQDVDGHPIIVGRDVATEQKIGTGGDTIFYVKKAKKMVPRYNKQTGINTYWVYIRADGEWVNIGMGDIDLSMREAKVTWNDNELKYARASLQSINRDRFADKPTFWAKYGTMIMNIIYIVIISIAIVFVTAKLVQLVGAIKDTQVIQNNLLDKFTSLFAKIDNICTSNNGLIKVA